MKGTILVVDDAADIRELLGNILRDDYEVAQAESGAALKQLFSDAQPDIVLLDIKLPDADGLDLLPQIKKQWPETEVVVLTGNATFEAAVEATKRGAYHFLNKPFDTQLCWSRSNAPSNTSSRTRKTARSAARCPR